MIQQVLRALLLSVDDMAQVARVMAKRGKGNGDADTSDADEGDDIGDGRIVPGRWDYIILGFTGLCIVLIFAAPVLTGASVEEVLAQIAEELTPFPQPDDLFDAD